MCYVVSGGLCVMNLSLLSRQQGLHYANDAVVQFNTNVVITESLYKGVSAEKYRRMIDQRITRLLPRVKSIKLHLEPFCFLHFFDLSLKIGAKQSLERLILVLDSQTFPLLMKGNRLMQLLKVRTNRYDVELRVVPKLLMFSLLNEASRVFPEVLETRPLRLQVFESAIVVYSYASAVEYAVLENCWSHAGMLPFLNHSATLVRLSFNLHEVARQRRLLLRKITSQQLEVCLLDYSRNLPVDPWKCVIALALINPGNFSLTRSLAMNSKGFLPTLQQLVTLYRLDLLNNAKRYENPVRGQQKKYCRDALSEEARVALATWFRLLGY